MQAKLFFTRPIFIGQKSNLNLTIWQVQMSFLTSEASFECIWTSLLGLVSIREEFDYIKDRIEIFIG